MKIKSAMLAALFVIPTLAFALTDRAYKLASGYLYGGNSAVSFYGYSEGKPGVMMTYDFKEEVTTFLPVAYNGKISGKYDPVYHGYPSLGNAKVTIPAVSIPTHGYPMASNLKPTKITCTVELTSGTVKEVLYQEGVLQFSQVASSGTAVYFKSDINSSKLLMIKSSADKGILQFNHTYFPQ